jgi:hypothetical protein
MVHFLFLVVAKKSTITTSELVEEGGNEQSSEVHLHGSKAMDRGGAPQARGCDPSHISMALVAPTRFA